MYSPEIRLDVAPITADSTVLLSCLTMSDLVEVSSTAPKSLPLLLVDLDASRVHTAPTHSPYGTPYTREDSLIIANSRVVRRLDAVKATQELGSFKPIG